MFAYYILYLHVCVEAININRRDRISLGKNLDDGGGGGGFASARARPAPDARACVNPYRTRYAAFTYIKCITRTRCTRPAKS